MRRFRLVPHPASPAPPLRLFLETARVGSRGLLLRYEAVGTIEDLALGPVALPQRRDGLWRTTCFECFLAEDWGRRYAEFNFAPSGAWAAYLFDSERRGMRNAPVAAPRLALASAPGRLSLTARVAFAGLPFAPARMGASAVLEWKRGGKSFHALAHPGGAPDFHAPSGFVVNVAAIDRTNGDAP